MAQQLYFNNRMAKRCVVVHIEPHLQAMLPQVSYEIECFFLRVPVDRIKFARELSNLLYMSEHKKKAADTKRKILRTRSRGITGNSP